MRNAIILAAGKGTRMKSEENKCMQKIMGKPMLAYLVDTLKSIKVDNIVIVVGYKQESIRDYFKDTVQYVEQQEQLGTAHAVMQAKSLEDIEGDTVILGGDAPLIKADTLKELFEYSKNYNLTILSTEYEDPARYGRIIRDENNGFLAIKEAKDCDENQILIKEVNSGIYCVDNKKLWEILPLIKNDNKQKEYYITDIVELFREKDYTAEAKLIRENQQLMGIDHRLSQAIATKIKQQEINNKHLENGVCLIDPNNTYIEEDVVIAKDTTIYPNVLLKGNTKIGSNVTLLSGCEITSSEIGDGCLIDNSKIIDCKLGENTNVGPMAHLRGNCEIGNECRIGNFVEMKKTIFGNGSKCAHLSYIGDSEVGKKVNIGCGVVTVNYDGKNKHKTIIKDGAFIGSNCNLVAPIVVGKNALVAAGSTIYKDVEDGDMAIARSFQENKAGFGEKYKNK